MSKPTISDAVGYLVSRGHTYDKIKDQLNIGASWMSADIALEYAMYHFPIGLMIWFNNKGRT